MSILGLDNSRPIISDHCRNLLISLLLVLTGHNDYTSLGKILLRNRVAGLGLKLGVPSSTAVEFDFLDSNRDVSEVICEAVPLTIPAIETDEGQSEEKQADERAAAVGEGLQKRLTEVIKSLVNFISSKAGQSFWNYEDTTSKTWNIQSSKQLESFVQNIARVFSDSQPHTILEERWAQFSLNLALSSPSRHYAGRSLQVFRALRIPVSLRMISDILSRLVETVAEQGEDMQGYVTELILTLESAVDSLDTDFRPIDLARDIFKSTPNLHKEAIGPKKGYSGVAGKLYNGWRDPNGHFRSTSYSVAYNSRRIVGSPAVDRREFGRNRSSTDCDPRRLGNGNLFRSRSASSLKGIGDVTSQEDKLTILAQLFWIAVCLLQSDFEHEFLLAIKLLQKVLEKFPLDRPDCRDKVEKLLVHLKWINFPGVVSLLLKGLTNPNTYEPTIGAVSSMCKLLNVSVVDPSGSSGFAFCVMALLPYMLAHYEDANDLCVKSAESIAQVSTEITQKLENLATVMTLYSRRTFSKESFQWTKCVVKYLHDLFSSLSLPLVSFLVEVLEKGPTFVHLPIMSILHSLLHYVDLSSLATSQQINLDLLRVTAKHMEGNYWKEALKIIKLSVTRSSTLVAPPFGESASLITTPITLDSDIFLRKELPGRTMEFSYELAGTPVIGRKSETIGLAENGEKQQGSASPRRSVSLGSADGNSLSGWKRPWLCQAKVRESLVNLLTSCGQKVGVPKSPSVIFSQGSDPLERQSSLASSMDEVSGQGNDHSGESKFDDSIATEQLRVFKDFDFLEYELESSEGDGMDRFNWGVQRHSLSNLDVDSAGRENFRDSTSASEDTHPSRNDVIGLEESSDDEIGSVSPLDERAPERNHPPNYSLTEDIPERSSNHSYSSHDECSEGDGGDVTPCNVSPSIPLMPSTAFRPIGTSSCTPAGLVSDECDCSWKRQIQGLVSEASVTPEQVLTALRMFNLLFKESRERISSYIQECQECLSSVESSCGRISVYPLISEYISSASDILGRQVEHPYIYCDQYVLTGNRLLDRLKFGLLELNELYEMCVDKKEQLIECLSLIQSSLGTSLGSNYTEIPYEDQILDIGKHTHKLLFQSLLLLETYLKVINHLNSTVKHTEGVDLSSDVEPIRQGLLASIDDDEVEPNSESEQNISMAQAEFTLIELLINRRYSKALKHVWQYRYIWPRGYFGNSSEDEVHGIIDIYCKYYSDKKGGCIFAIIFSEEKMAEQCEKLMENVLLIQSALKSAEHGNIGISNTTMKTEC